MVVLFYELIRALSIDVSHGGALRSRILVLEQSTTLAGRVCLVVTIVLPTFWCRAAAISRAYRVVFWRGLQCPPHDTNGSCHFWILVSVYLMNITMSVIVGAS